MVERELIKNLEFDAKRDALTVQLIEDQLHIYLTAKKQLGDNYVIINKQGNYVSNPLVKVMGDAYTHVHDLLKNFNTNPMSRKRLQGEIDEPSALDEFLEK